MAHFDPRHYRTQSPDRAFVCEAARTWHALVVTAVLLMVVAPALVVGVLTLVESAFPHLRPLMADGTLERRPGRQRLVLRPPPYDRVGTGLRPLGLHKR
jgi:hypothetical protein